MATLFTKSVNDYPVWMIALTNNTTADIITQIHFMEHQCMATSICIYTFTTHEYCAFYECLL